MFAIFKREVKAYFYSPIAYVLIGLFMALSAVQFAIVNINNRIASIDLNLSFMTIVLIFIIPILTMKLLAEERKNGTEVMLITYPVRLSSIVLGKYFAALFVFLVMTVLTFIYPLILIAFDAPFTAQMVGGYIGFIFLGGAMIAFGLFASSLTENQIIAAVVGIIGMLFMYFLQGMATSAGGILSVILGWFSLFSRYEDLNNGLLNIASLVYYISFIGIFIFLTVRVIEKRRWSQG